MTRESRSCKFETRPEKPWLVSSTGRTSPLRTIRLDLGFDLLGRHGRDSGWNHLLPGGLHLSDTNCCESLAQDCFERARLKQALGGVLGEGGSRLLRRFDLGIAPRQSRDNC